MLTINRFNNYFAPVDTVWKNEARYPFGTLPDPFVNSWNATNIYDDVEISERLYVPLNAASQMIMKYI
jgi:hypothetical protein